MPLPFVPTSSVPRWAGLPALCLAALLTGAVATWPAAAQPANPSKIRPDTAPGHYQAVEKLPCGRSWYGYHVSHGDDDQTPDTEDE
ncbi:hypothetical protein, partial [Tepidicella xavieri]|uniref:hypothetical protein n=1 Tax=Tepidicella xavieri TaxID=360241 RepID=UPI001B86D03C